MIGCAYLALSPGAREGEVTCSSAKFRKDEGGQKSCHCDQSGIVVRHLERFGHHRVGNHGKNGAGRHRLRRRDDISGKSGKNAIPTSEAMPEIRAIAIHSPKT